MSNPLNSLSNPHTSDHESQIPPPHTSSATPTTTAVAGKPHFSVFTQTISRQLHTVASFLSPPPPQPYSSSSSGFSTLPVPEVYSGDVLVSSYEGLKNDLAEIGDSLKTAVTGISKLASNLLLFDKRSDFGVVGVTDDVVDFVKWISIRPEIWIEFPLSLQNQDFRMSGVQKDHAFVIQDMVPNLATLRHKIRNVMSEQQFWLIYFILLVPRLSEDDCRLLSTLEILQLHEMLLQKVRNNKNTTNEKDSMINKTKIESSSETDNATIMTKTKNREDAICFSEVEDEEMKQTQSSRVSSASENSDWVRISGTSKANRSMYRGRRSESEGSSSDWHDVEDVDL